jgi:antitoxin component of RelBE/YafQ-DinJ toxin-antitoxin module
MQRTVLQIPINLELKNEAEQVAQAQGFSSLQEVVRVFLSRFAQKRIGITFEESVRLTPQAIKRYDKMANDIQKGNVKIKTFTDTNSLMKHLEK